MKLKTSNLITLLFFLVLIAVMVLIMCFRESPSGSVSEVTDDSLYYQSVVSGEARDGAGTAYAMQTTANTAASPNKTVSMDDALFIGDSRTVGIAEYAGIDGADFFSDVGMGVNNIYNKKVSVASVGDVTLDELLKAKKYGKIYIMLGVNDVGYDFEQTVTKYRELLDAICQAQPDAVIFLQANLHVTKSRSDTDSVVNNGAINSLNAAIASLADGSKIFYIDANPVFDDSSGALAADTSGDNTHLYAKYYKQWGDWIVAQSAYYL